jgi:hypothetical protein
MNSCWTVLPVRVASGACAPDQGDAYIISSAPQPTSADRVRSQARGGFGDTSHRLRRAVQKGALKQQTAGNRHRVPGTVHQAPCPRHRAPGTASQAPCPRHRALGSITERIIHVGPPRTAQRRGCPCNSELIQSWVNTAVRAAMVNWSERATPATRRIHGALWNVSIPETISCKSRPGPLTNKLARSLVCNN